MRRASDRSGTVAHAGRYHKRPERLENDYEQLDVVLGKGFNGQVYLAKSRDTGAKFAVKHLHLRNVSRSERSLLINELEIFLQMDHPHIARLVDVYEVDDKNFKIVMECMLGGELLKRVTKQKGKFEEREVADLARQMLLALNYLHSHEIVHRDLKLENWLFEAEDSDNLELIDFGFSKMCQGKGPMSQGLGTLPYMAPEVLSPESYTEKCDMWSFGVIMFILLFGYPPFWDSENMERIIPAVKAGKYEVKAKKWERVSECGQSFVKDLLVVNPKQRLTAASALNHEWIQKHERMRSSRTPMTPLEIANTDNQVVSALSGYAQASDFKRACMTMMAWSLTNEDRAVLREAFLGMDTTRSGTITEEEFMEVLKKHGMSDRDIKAAFSSIDASRDKEIHYSEFLAAMVSTRKNLHDDLLKATFRRFDKDKSDSITVENLQQVFGPSVPKKKILEMLKEVSTSPDGAISYDELAKYIRDDPLRRRSDGAGDIFERQTSVQCQQEERQTLIDIVDKEIVAVEDAPHKPSPSPTPSGCVAGCVHWASSCWRTHR